MPDGTRKYVIPVRPPDSTPPPHMAVVEALCEWCSEGKGITVFCKQPGNPPLQTVYKWMTRDPVVAEMIRTAQLCGTWVIVQDILDIADDAREDHVLGTDSEGNPKMLLVKENIARSRLRCDARWKFVAAIGPAVWGTKLAVSGDPNAPPVMVSLSDAERVHKVKKLLGIAETRPRRNGKNGHLDSEDDENVPVE
jgi:hypothetical protein